MKWDGRRVAVLGFARSGEAAARALLARGARVTAFDIADDATVRERAARIGVDGVFGRADGEDVRGFDLVVSSPGVPPSSSWIKTAQAAEIPVWSEIELAYQTGVRPAIAITGTNGKTTTAEMTVAALRSAGISAVAAGNIGMPLMDATGPAIVAELSSFQLHGIREFRAPVAVLLNVARDHLDWHGSFEAYVADKRRIFENQAPSDTAVVHAACGRFAAAARAQQVPFSELFLPEGGAGVTGGWIVVPQGRVLEVSRMRAHGRPNLADAVAAAAAACAIGTEPARAGEGIAAYRPQPHRIEALGTHEGVAYINDSKATDPHAVLAALEDLEDVVLIAGGRNKGLDLSALAQAGHKLRAVVAIGEAAAEIEDTFAAEGVPVERARTMDEAVEIAHALAKQGDTVLLSPACGSFDMFADYRARGEAFRAAVARIGGRR